MAKTTEFSHDTLGHLLKDRKLEIPRFQRTFSWEEDNVHDYWDDIARAKEKGDSYFLGTVVLADIESEEDRKYVVDGQQRITTTALTFIAIVKKLEEMEKFDASKKMESDHISDYDIFEEEVVPKLILSAHDSEVYEKLVSGRRSSEILEDLPKQKKNSKLFEAYCQLEKYIDELAVADVGYKELTSLSRFLDENAQVLLAVASGLSEAYVIFETLNDRGAALTTADLLKNFFLSTAGEKKVNQAEKLWTSIADKFDRSDKLVAFIKADYTSKWGPVKVKELYSSIQEKVGRSGAAVIKYLTDLLNASSIYIALTSPDDQYWSSISDDIRDEILAHRRFQIEAPFPMYMAAFRKLRPSRACELMRGATGWAVRASLASKLGGGTAEKLYGEAAAAISDGDAKNLADVRSQFSWELIVPDDDQFKNQILAARTMSLTRVKYLLAMVEKQYRLERELNVDAFPAWDSKSVTVEHIVAKSKKFDGSEEGVSKRREWQNSIPNLALLEKKINGDLRDDEFLEKKEEYRQSEFMTTAALADLSDFGESEISERADSLAEYACRAWPF